MLCKWICSSSKTFPSILKLRFCESGIFECQMLAIWTPTQTEFGQLQSNHLQIAGLTLGPAQTALPDPCHCSAFEFLPSNANPTQPKTQNLFTKIHNVLFLPTTTHSIKRTSDITWHKFSFPVHCSSG